MSLDIRTLDRKMVKQSNVKIIKCGNIIELYEYATPYYYNLGKTKQHDNAIEEEDSSRAMRTDNIGRTQRKIKRLINSNSFVYGHRPKFVTYTFARNVTSIREANRVFNNNRQNLVRHFGRKLRYLAVPELQKRGAIHYHVVYFDLPYTSNIKEIFKKSWGEGFVQVKAIEHVYNVGAYISKYFSKQWASERVIGTKGFFTASGLYQPEIYRTIDILKTFAILREEYKEVVISAKFGTVTYTQFNTTTTQQLYESTSNNTQSSVRTLRGQEDERDKVLQRNFCNA